MSFKLQDVTFQNTAIFISLHGYAVHQEYPAL